MFENSLKVRELFVIEIDFITNFVKINLLFDHRGKLHIYMYMYIHNHLSLISYIYVYFIRIINIIPIF